MKIIMKHMANYIVSMANKGVREFQEKVEFLNSNIVEEREKFFVFKDEQVPEVSK